MQLGSNWKSYFVQLFSGTVERETTLDSVRALVMDFLG